jgi:23S rRNA (adenine2030-N6)-methyltransferase
MTHRVMAAAEPSTSDYSHRFHAGNVGDVWKHCVLVAALRAAVRGERPLVYVETHAGAGRYALGPTGEWTEGVGRFDAAALADPVPGAIRDYKELLVRDDIRGPREYPGSPVFARALLRDGDRAVLHETDAGARRSLEAAVGGDPRCAVHGNDGLAALPDVLRGQVSSGADLFVLVDPSWGGRPEWTAVPNALVAAWRAAPHARFALWYPVKSHTRPNAMMQMLQTADVPGTAIELITTPLTIKRHRLNGSGMLLVHPPPGVVEAVAAAAPVLGRACATHAGSWSSRALGWSSGGIGVGARARITSVAPRAPMRRDGKERD